MMFSFSHPVRGVWAGVLVNDVEIDENGSKRIVEIFSSTVTTESFNLYIKLILNHVFELYK